MISVKLLMNDSPFRGACWAVLKDGQVAAYCFDEKTAQALQSALSVTELADALNGKLKALNKTVDETVRRVDRWRTS